MLRSATVPHWASHTPVPKKHLSGKLPENLCLKSADSNNELLKNISGASSDKVGFSSCKNIDNLGSPGFKVIRKTDF